MKDKTIHKIVRRVVNEALGVINSSLKI